MGVASMIHLPNGIFRLPRLAAKLPIRSRMGLQGRTIALLLAVMFGAGAYAVILQMYDSQRLIYAAQLRHSTDLAAALAAAGAPLLAADDRDGLSRLCSQAMREGPTLFAMFVTAGGERISVVPRAGQRFADVVDRYGAAAQWPLRPGARLFRDRRTGLVLSEVSYPVVETVGMGDVRRASPPGQVCLICDASPAEQAVHIMARRLLQLVAGLSLVTVPLTFLIVRRIVHPLNQMASAAARFANDDLSPRVPVKGTDEIAELARALNTMADGLTASRNEMLAFNEELGRQVRERTRELADLAARDPLTSLYNRRHFAEALSHEFAAAVRYHEDLSLMMVDLDNFKGVNDTHGHHVGDEVLLLTTKVISDELRSADIAARYGGDEFIAMLPHTPDTDAESLASRVRELLRQRAAQALPHVPVDVSVGIASLRTTDALSPDDLIREVDKALYAVKRSGKGRIARAPGRRQGVSA
jgi:diguanylate cyclase (GGDEF)-like protein